MANFQISSSLLASSVASIGLKDASGKSVTRTPQSLPSDAGLSGLVTMTVTPHEASLPTISASNLDITYSNLVAMSFSSVNDLLRDYLLKGDDNLTLANAANPPALYGYAGNDSLTGASYADRIDGGEGNDTIVGGGGGDTLIGGAGSDIYVVDSVGDVVEEALPNTEGSLGGNDTVQSSVTYTLGQYVDNLTLTGSLAINATGNAMANRLTGNNAANIIDGAGGNDTLDGAGGSDIYLLGQPSALGPNLMRISDTGTSGVDEVRITSTTDKDTLTFSADEKGIERVVIGTGAAVNAVITGTASICIDASLLGNKLTIIGNDGNNLIYGTAFADSIAGGGGSDDLVSQGGKDTMAGGLGDDRYYTSTSQVLIKESAAEGLDTIYSTASAYTLPQNVERLILVYFGTDDLPLLTNISATGNALGNEIIGNSAANIIDGAAGIDTLIGGAGSDVYVVDANADVVFELSGGGNADIVKSTATNFSLSSNVENLTLMGKANINGTGNSAANVIIGNAGNNVLTSAGGGDTLSGGAGADAFVLSGSSIVSITDFGNGADILTNSSDTSVTMTMSKAWVATEASRNDGFASILSNGLKVDLSKIVLGNGFSISNIKDGATGAKAANFTGTGLADRLNGGTGADNLIGGAGNDALSGGDGNDALSGGDGNDFISGGAGNDLITGGAGNDIFWFSATPAANTNVDTITDFLSTDQDKINFDASVYTGFATVNDGADFFESGGGLKVATLEGTRVIYNTTSGALYYDQDGSLADHAAVQIAVIGKSTHPALTLSDFLLVI